MQITVSSGWARISAVALAASLVWGAAPAWASPASHAALPSLGDGADLSLTDERRIGDQIARSIYRDPLYLDDPAISAYLQAMWQPLVQAALRRGDLTPDVNERYAWQLLVGRDRQVNAFALPGGYLGVYLGLISVVDAPEELASVLAHELAHVSQRHISRLITRQGQQAPWVVGAMILGALAANAARNVDIASAAIVGGQAVAIQNQLNFSRDMEREADRIGFGILAEAGFNPQGFVTMFDKLQAASRLNDDGAFPYLRSHPLTTERMADMRARAPEWSRPGESLPPPLPTASAPVSAAYHALMSARARVLAENQIDRLRAIALTLKQPRPAGANDTHTLAQWYAATLAASRVRDAALVHQGLQALSTLRRTLVDPQSQQALTALHNEVLLALPPESLPAAAVAHLRAQVPLGLATSSATGDPVREAMLQSAYISLQWQASALRPVTQRLQAWTALHPLDALAWQTLSRVHAAQQQPARAARADAEARLAHLDTSAAIDRLRAAQQLARQHTDHIEASIIDARLRQVQSQFRQEQLDAR